MPMYEAGKVRAHLFCLQTAPRARLALAQSIVGDVRAMQQVLSRSYKKIKNARVVQEKLSLWLLCKVGQG